MLGPLFHYTQHGQSGQWLSELLPKALTLRHVTAAAALTAVPVLVISRLIQPLVWLMNTMANAVTRPLGLGRVDEIESENVTIGEGSSIWDNVHIRHGASLGEECIVGEKSYIAYDVKIGDRVKINAMVYICAAVTIEDGVMISASTTFTNDRFPRATFPDLKTLRPSEPDEHTLPTLVREGATIGAGCVIGNDLAIGRWAMVGMGSVVTRTVPDFHLVLGSPARCR